jgi:ketosteroid isomerase-like protein
LAADKPEDVLLKADRDFNQATAERRLEGWMSYFASSAVLFGVEPPVVGQEAIRKFYEHIFANPDFQLSWEPARGEMFASGDTGYTTGRYEMRAKNAKGEAVVRHGHYLTVWKKQTDGSWKVVADGGAPDK